MIKTILVPTGGSDTVFVLFETALAVAQLFRAHLEFFHVRVDAVEALRYSSAEPTRAIAAAMPLLIKAKRVIITSVEEDRPSANAAAVAHAYCRGPVRESIFDGCTQSVLEHADVPVFLFH
jgi:nucleotide-binding universal stress UspA family protein